MAKLGLAEKLSATTKTVATVNKSLNDNLKIERMAIQVENLKSRHEKEADRIEKLVERTQKIVFKKDGKLDANYTEIVKAYKDNLEKVSVKETKQAYAEKFNVEGRPKHVQDTAKALIDLKAADVIRRINRIKVTLEALGVLDTTAKAKAAKAKAAKAKAAKAKAAKAAETAEKVAVA